MTHVSPFCKLIEALIIIKFLYFLDLFPFIDAFFAISHLNLYLALGYFTCAYSQRHLQGTSYRDGNMAHPIVSQFTRATFILFLSNSILDIYCHIIHPRIIHPHIIHPHIFYNLLILYSRFYFDGTDNTYISATDFNSPFRRILSIIFSKIKCQIINDGSGPIEKQAIFGLHPHGLFPIGQLSNVTLHNCGKKEIANICPQLEKNNVVGVAASFCFYVPIMRELMLLLGIMDCSRPNVDKALKDGKTIAVFMGGAKESKYSGLGRADLVIRKRRGIFEMAIENGIPLVPSYTFGENDLFTAYDFDIFGIFAFLQRCTGICWPRGIPTFLLPEFIMIVGKPIMVTKINKGEYTYENVNELREKYITEITALFNRHKHLDKTCKNTEMRILA